MSVERLMMALCALFGAAAVLFRPPRLEFRAPY